MKGGLAESSNKSKKNNSYQQRRLIIMNIMELKLQGTTREEKLNYLNDNLNTSGAMEQYTNCIDKKFNKLSEDVYLAKKLEAYASWLLKSEKGDFDLLTDKQRIKAEASKVVHLKGESNEIDDKFLEANKANGNCYKSNAIVITPALLKEDSELGEILREYQPLREMLGKELQKVKNRQATKLIVNQEGETVPLNYRMIREHLGEVNADMKLSISKLKGLEGERPTPTKARAMDCDTIDYSNANVIKKLIGTGLIDLENRTTCKSEMLSIITVDLSKALEALELSVLDSSIISMYNDGWQVQEIGQEVNLHHSNVGRRIYKVCGLISDQLG